MPFLAGAIVSLSMIAETPVPWEALGCSAMLQSVAGLPTGSQDLAGEQAVLELPYQNCGRYAFHGRRDEEIMSGDFVE